MNRKRLACDVQFNTIATHAGIGQDINNKTAALHKLAALMVILMLLFFNNPDQKYFEKLLCVYSKSKSIPINTGSEIFGNSGNFSGNSGKA